MKTNEHAKYTYLTVELIPTAEDAAMLQKTWDAHYNGPVNSDQY